MQPGYYWIKHEGLALPARFDGEKFNHEKGSHFDEDEKNIIGPITFSCPTGCACTVNSDGTTKVDCHPQ